MTPLYERMAAPEGPHAQLMREVWSHNKWMIDVKFGSFRDDNYMDILHWCRDNLGDQTWPYGDDKRWGKWLRGSATIDGWDWLGFDTEESMNQFIAAWKDRVELERPRP